MFVGQNYNDNAIINTDEVGYAFIFFFLFFEINLYILHISNFFIHFSNKVDYNENILY